MMRYIKNELVFSPSDLITFMESPYASWMDRLKIESRKFDKTEDLEDPLMVALQKRGYAHEAAVIEQMKADGRDVLEIERGNDRELAKATLNAMKMGIGRIAQGVLYTPPFAGRADLLVKVPGPSAFGNYHYEVWDIKLSKKMKPYFAVQICCYAELLEQIQGVRPQEFGVVLGSSENDRRRLADYFSYYRSLKQAFLEQQESFDPAAPKDPATCAQWGRWSTVASDELEARDHLSQVATMSRQQIVKLERSGIATMTALAESDLDHVPKIGDAVLARLKDQARMQIASSDQETPAFEVRQHDTGLALGLSSLPPHSPMDVFFDIEGYPLVEGGLEYLWGNAYYEEDGTRAFKDFWAHDAEQEKQAFQEFVAWVYARWEADPSMHIYHYAAYETTAVRKLMGRHGVCEDEVDALLRNQVFVDLYQVVRQALIIGEPRYSIKNVEHIYRGKRDTEVASGGESIVVYEAWREDPDGPTCELSETLKNIRDYNIDDCNSTEELVRWLRDLQREQGIGFQGLVEKKEIDIPEEVAETIALRDRILTFADAEEKEERQSILHTLAWSLEFHRRESKPTFWRKFDRLAQSDIGLFEDMDCLAGLKRTAEAPWKPTPKARNLAYQFQFDPEQNFKGVSKRYFLHGHENWRLTLIDHDLDEGLITLQSKEEPPTSISIIPDEHVPEKPIPEAIRAVVEAVLDDEFAPSAITDFLTRSRPRIRDNESGPIISGHGDFIEEVIEAAENLDNSCLCIQGPPGAGKTFTAKHIIARLLKSGKRVGITSNSHKAINNLLKGVADQVLEDDIDTALLKIDRNDEDPLYQRADIALEKSAKAASYWLMKPGYCIGGTAWAFCNKDFRGQFDYLFVDEAGQVSVANLIGCSGATQNIVLMGDQMQLGQPTQGSHPGESGMSILDYLLRDQATIPSDLGIFLPKTYRMHPDVCSFISDMVYEGRLEADDVTLTREIELAKDAEELLKRNTGIRFLPTEHEGNTQGSDEEVAVIGELCEALIGLPFQTGKTDTSQRPIDWQDILLVAPYNFQVNKLKAALGPEARVGSVDKFQGQEAPVVILSMCASDASESPRGIDFLFSKNRLNVALSRAQCLAIVVGHPALANTPVKTIQQMALVNFYCGMTQA